MWSHLDSSAEGMKVGDTSINMGDTKRLKSPTPRFMDTATQLYIALSKTKLAA
jgi:hypothetical protein